MSEDKQRAARDRRDAAKQREADARERAQRNRERGDARLGELHEDAAGRQASAAEAAERERVGDVKIEGNKLPDEPDEDATLRGSRARS